MNPRSLRLDRPLRLFTLLGVLGWLSGCADVQESEPTLERAQPVPFPGCETFDYAPCDVLDPACQTNLFDLVRCVRGTPGEGSMPLVKTLTTAEYRDLLNSTMADETSTTNDAMDRAMFLLGLAKSGDLSASTQVDVLVDTATAFYSEQLKEIVLVVPDQPLSSSSHSAQPLALAHELVHALQDQEHDLVTWKKGADSFDSFLAMDAVIEGEAELYQTFLAAAFWGYSQADVDFVGRFNAQSKLFAEPLKDQSPLVSAQRIFPYSYGGRYAYLAWKSGGPAAVTALFDDPPKATELLMASESEVRADPLVALEGGAPDPLPGSTLVGETKLGAWILSQFFTRQGIDGERFAKSWRGERLSVYRDEAANKVSVFWRIRLASASDAEAMVAAWLYVWRAASGGGVGSHRVAQLGEDVLLVAGEAEAGLSAWLPH